MRFSQPVLTQVGCNQSQHHLKSHVLVEDPWYSKSRWCLVLSGSRRMQSPVHSTQFTQVVELCQVQHKEPSTTTKSKSLQCTEPIYDFCFLKSYNWPITKTTFPPDSEQLSRILRKIQPFCCAMVFKCSEHQAYITLCVVQTWTFAALGTSRLCGSPLFNCLRTHIKHDWMRKLSLSLLRKYLF